MLAGIVQGGEWRPQYIINGAPHSHLRLVSVTMRRGVSRPWSGAEPLAQKSAWLGELGGGVRPGEPRAQETVDHAPRAARHDFVARGSRIVAEVLWVNQFQRSETDA